MMLRERIIKEIEKITLQGVDFSVFRPEREAFGDYSSNVALIAAKKNGKNPREVAGDLKNKLENSKLFSKVDVAGPGFLNFWLSNEETVRQFHALSRQKGLPKLSLGKGKKILIDYVSANPTGPLTLANVRGGFLGDVLSNILELADYKAERHYYVNDTGNQIITLGKSILASVGLLSEEENFYGGEYIKEWAQKNKGKVKKLKDKPLMLGQEAAKDFLRSIKNSLAKKAKIKFDHWQSETRLHKEGFVEKAFKLFQSKNLVYEKDGAKWLKTTDFDDDKDRVLVTSDGYPTYFLADAGLFLKILSRGHKKAIYIFGPDHYGYVARMNVAAETLGMEDFEIIITQTVRLMKGGKEFKMSKRKGTFVAFEDLIDAIGLDAARWFFLEHSSDTHIDINLDLAKEKSQKNPVYYVQYAHARICSILGKANKATSHKQKATSYSADELKFIKKILEVSDVLADTVLDYQIHRLTTYTYELAQAFSAFYRDVKVLDSGPDESRRLLIVKTGKNVLGSLLRLLGISAPERM